MRVEESGVAGLLGEVDALRADVLGDASPLVRVVGHALRVRESRGEVHFGSRPGQAEGLPGAPVAHEPRCAGKRTHGCRAAVEGRAADAPALHERHGGAQLHGVKGGAYPGGATTEDDDTELVLLCHAVAVMSMTTLMSSGSFSSADGHSSGASRGVMSRLSQSRSACTSAWPACS